MTDRTIIGGALVLSVVVHLGVLALSAGREPPAIEGGAASAEPAQIGNSFRDVAQGAPAAAPTGAPDIVRPATTEVRPPLPVETAAPVPVPVAAAPAPAPSRMPPSEPAEVATSPSPQASAVASLQPARRAEAAATAPVPETVAATVQPPEDAPRAVSGHRPAPRPERAAHAPSPPGPPATRAASTPGAERAERRGQDEGQEGAASERSAAAPSSAARDGGDARASTYPGLVMRQLSRTPRPEAGRRGAAVVGFEVGSGGELRRAVILRSSGHEAIDRAAVEHLRRAAPFPAPPQGADRRFQVRYESRG
jgi:protein TonB